jgi:hypothetical protein
VISLRSPNCWIQALAQSFWVSVKERVRIDAIAIAVLTALMSTFGYIHHTIYTLRTYPAGTPNGEFVRESRGRRGRISRYFVSCQLSVVFLYH